MERPQALLSHQTVMLVPAFVAFLSALTMSAPPPLRVDLVFEGAALPPKIEPAVMEEVTAIWARYGVDVQPVGLQDAGREGAVRLNVVLADRADRRMPFNALGSIAFVEDTPQPVIVMYPNAVADIISLTSLQGRHESEWPRMFRDAVFGRVLGRALAHELGHYLLRSRGHAVAGLMRAAQPGIDLVSADRHAFSLSPTEVTRLVSVALPTAAP